MEDQDSLKNKRYKRAKESNEMNGEYFYFLVFIIIQCVYYSQNFLTEYCKISEEE